MTISSSPTLSIITIIFKDEILSGRFYCCSVLLATLLSGISANNSSIPKDLIRSRIIEMYCTVSKYYSTDSVRAARRVSTSDTVPVVSTDSARSTADDKNRIDEQHLESNKSRNTSEILKLTNIQEEKRSRATLENVIRTFKLAKLLSPKGFGDISFNFGPLGKRLSQPLQVSYLRQKCEKEMFAVSNPKISSSSDGNNNNTDNKNKKNSNNNKNNKNDCDFSDDNDDEDDNDNVEKERMILGMEHGQEHGQEHEPEPDRKHNTTLVATDVMKNILTDASSLKQNSRALFLSAAEIAATAIRQEGSTDECDLLGFDQSVNTLLASRSRSFSLRTHQTVRVLPQAVDAVSNIDIGSSLTLTRHTRTDSRTVSKSAEGLGVSTSAEKNSSSSVSTLIRSLCVGLLLTGDVRTVGLIISDIMNRKDISMLCDFINDSMMQRSDDQLDHDGDIKDSNEIENENEIESKSEIVNNVDNDKNRVQESHLRGNITDDNSRKLSKACLDVFEFLLGNDNYIP